MSRGEVDRHADFDREVRFDEVFLTPEGTDFLRWLHVLLSQEMLVVGRNGSVPLPPTSEKLRAMPIPVNYPLPDRTTLFKGGNGISFIGIPVVYEGDTFALLLFDSSVSQDKALWNKLKTAASMVEWYVYVVHQRRMILELHDHTQADAYGGLLREHEKVLQSEANYRQLAEMLEQKVEERKKELEEAQRQLVQQEKMASIGQLAAGVAHEINNPTGYVHSNLEVLRNYHSTMIDVLNAAKELILKSNLNQAGAFLEKWDEHDMEEILTDLPALVEQSLKGTDRIAKIVRGLSRFSHIDNSELDSININELLDSSVELLWNEIKYKAKLIRNYGNVPKIKGISNQLTQVFVNVIMNALQSIDGHGEITLTTIPAPSCVEVEVADNGCGIPRENISHIFEPFFTTKPVGKGTGLGLAISYEIVASHKGEIWAESETGKGTTFHIRLPAEKTDPNIHTS